MKNSQEELDQEFKNMGINESENVIKEYEEELKDVVMNNSSNIDQLQRNSLFLSPSPARNPKNVIFNERKGSIDLNIMESSGINSPNQNYFSNSKLAKDAIMGKKFTISDNF